MADVQDESKVNPRLSQDEAKFLAMSTREVANAEVVASAAEGAARRIFDDNTVTNTHW